MWRQRLELHPKEVEQPVAAVPRDNIVCVFDICRNQLLFIYLFIYLFIESCRRYLTHLSAKHETRLCNIKKFSSAPQIAQSLHYKDRLIDGV
jgi:hypothetical protein